MGKSEKTGGAGGQGRRSLNRNLMIYLSVFAAAAAGMTLMYLLRPSEAVNLAAEGTAGLSGSLAGSYAGGLFAVSLLALGAAGYWVIRTGAGMEKIFLWTALPLGILYLMMMAPLAAPDEQAHYQTSYQVSNLLLFRGGQPAMGTAAHFDYTGLGGHYNLASGYDRIAREFFQPLADGTEKAIRQYQISWLPMYLPQAIGIAAARILGLGFLPLFYLGRLMNLLFYILCVYFALRSMPRYQLLLGMIALLPMNLHQAASYSYDAYINGMTYLLIALILKAAWNPDATGAGSRPVFRGIRPDPASLKKAWRAGIFGKGTISRKEAFSILLVILLWAPAKPVYTPVLLMLFLIPGERFGGRGKKILCCGGVICIGLAEAFAVQMAGITGAMGAGGASGTNWEGQKNYSLDWVLSQPGDALKLLLSSFRTQYQDLLYESLGSYMGGLTILLPRRYMKIYLVLLLLCVLRRTEDATTDRSAASLGEPGFRIGIWARAIWLTASAAAVFLVMFTMMLAWTSEGATQITGVQGRYFLPVVMLPVMCLDNRALVLHRNPDKAVWITGLILHEMTIIGVLQATLTA